MLATATVALGALALLLAVGCRKQPPAEVSPVRPPGDQRADRPGEGLRIAVVPKALIGEYWVDCKDGAEAAAAELGCELYFEGPQNETDTAQQVTIIENLVLKGIDGLAISPCSADALVRPAKQAADKGVKVVTVDSDLADADARLCYIGTDNREGGKIAGHKLAEVLGEKGKVAIVNGAPSAQNCVDRVDGFRESIAAYPGIEIVDEQTCQSQRELALQVSENILSQHSDLNGFFTVNAPGAPGAGLAVRNKGLTGTVQIVGFDLLDESLELLRDGVVQALIAQKPYDMGKLAVEKLVAACRGEELEPLLDTGVDVVTLENVDEIAPKEE
jgi:ribose transport system substrate-binding protein